MIFHLNSEYSAVFDKLWSDNEGGRLLIILYVRYDVNFLDIG
jgi:hypothetical protein